MKKIAKEDQKKRAREAYESALKDGGVEEGNSSFCTPGKWAMIPNDVCRKCGKPPKGCMCL